MKNTSRSHAGSLWNICGTYGLSWLWVSFLVVFLQILVQARIGGYPPLSATLSILFSIPAAAAYLQVHPGLVVFSGLVFAPLFEEAVFRMLPMSWAQGKDPRLVRAVQIAICGCLFGIVHGSPINVLIQGFVGYMLSVLYLKNGPSQAVSYASCVFVHAAYNFTVLAAVAVAR